MVQRLWVLAALAGCAGDDTDGDNVTADVVIDHFEPDVLTEAITTEACTLSGGTATTCYRISVTGQPTTHDVGPFCPRSITDDASVAGIWIEDGAVWDVDGAFIVGLAEFYSDDAWQLYDASTGLVNVTDTQASCEAAARPDVDPAYNNYCVECSLDYLDDTTSTYLIPVTPVPLDQVDEIGNAGVVGVAFNGIDYDPPAPVQAILAAHTIAAFDDCGGHVNTNAGYHYHGSTGCPPEIAQEDGHGPMIGYAIDGYGLFAMLDEDGTEPDDLDECRGHSDGTRGYHYHVASPGENAFIGCFHGEQGSREGDSGPPR